MELKSFMSRKMSNHILIIYKSVIINQKMT